ncbi:hypothetical protein E1287_05530 [Actinomadura sp. KC06]|uniref:hypothetical protein n=1 Tax=Actinomadura sp. KC06 TaxID=2530369 RepID=UPI00104C5DE7|nr:hypothetical protein [Actinomadura sp. KC06]TDD38500.1 hypothetical protein E1287_05530 [Actinomadura sp. KC06]
MKALPYLAGPAARHAWAEREYARLQADIVEATLIARARSIERAGRIRRWLRDGVPDRIGAQRHGRRPAPPAAGCKRAAARSAHVLRTAGGVR